VPPAPPERPEPPVAAAVPPPVAEHVTAPPPPYLPPAQPDNGFYESLRVPAEPPPVSRVRRVWGALLAVAAVLLVIGGFWLFNNNDESGGGPTVALPPAATTTQAPTPTPTPSSTAVPRPTPTATAPVVRATTPPPAVAPIRPVLVLNNSRVKGLADRSAAKFQAGGWPLAGKPTNYSGGVVAQTTIYYAPGQLGSAQRFAKQFGIPRVLPRFSGLPGTGLTVVLTRDYR